MAKQPQRNIAVFIDVIEKLQIFPRNQTYVSF
jgi:hypothetical protein